MTQLIHDLTLHQTWADIEHWNALGRGPSALERESVRKRLYHIHTAQDAFILIVERKPIVIRPFEEFSAVSALREYAKQCHTKTAVYMRHATESMLREKVTIPWQCDPPLSVTAEQALLQAVMHSHYHRAQNATELRALGGEPPITDILEWYRQGKPEARWNF